MAEYDEELEWFLLNNDLGRFRKSVEQGADIHSKDRDGRTILMYAVIENKPEAVALLIEHGADVNAREQQMWTALHFAARDQRADIARMLVAAGAEIDPLDSYGNTPLSNCTYSFHGDSATLTILLEHGADPEKENNYEQSPLGLAKLKGNLELQKILRQYLKKH